MSEDKFSDLEFPALKAIKEAYRTGQEDESLEPLIGVGSSGKPIGRFNAGDSVVFYDLRGEREAELTQSLTDLDFSHFQVKKNLRLNFVTLIEYHSSLQVRVAFPPDGKLQNTLGEVVAKAGLKLLKVSESEKAIHLGFFMNGKNEEAFPGEERLIVPSPQVSSYTSCPEMSACQVSEALVQKVKDKACRLIIANLANVDVVGHSEDLNAVIRAVETVDKELGRIAETCWAQGIALVITSDHGTVEEWLYPDGTVNTGHTKNPVPFILADFSVSQKRGSLRMKGELIDVAPTVLDLLGLPRPQEMTGESLILESLSPDKERRVLLLILDGWGWREEKEGNLIFEAKTPNFDRLWSVFLHTLLEASGEAVGLPSQTVGNSEAGHLHLGAGRRVFLDRVKIDMAIEDGTFFTNPAFIWAMEEAKKKNRALHLLGIVSHYSSHGTIRHLYELLSLAQRLAVPQVFIHALIGRRGERPESGAIYACKVEERCRSLAVGRVATVMGRYWALDREENWDRVEKAYRALVYGEGKRFLAGD